MPINKTMTAPNGAAVTYHKPGSAEVNYQQGVAVVRVLSWANQASHDAAAGNNPVWSWPITIAIADVANVELAITTSGIFAGGSIVADLSGGLPARRARHWAFIKQQREAREYAGFTWDGSTFDSDPDSRARITGAVIEAQALGPEFTRTWRLADNTLRVLDAKDMLEVGRALGAHVGRVFDIGNALYQQIQASDDPESITWPASVETQLSEA
ncbi:DUF4376 domain-containing protein [Aquincola tertiaricarbonis]|uniref:DUF4376 domain-containing protein n=1 Tax=Aquincola tertiaricarbonis TaxID=391953 RepID=A0ABY4SA55_AQUTE|nr:DUF4376 domain-containing protein [Aquincola tertiaricarbonis]URI08921.1 DUF4376 domain-containing protein [Aquincola tertiaricarbonis]